MPEPNRRLSSDDRIVSVLAAPRRRAVLAALAVAGEPLAVEVLTERLHDGTEGQRRRVRLTLHHTDLPKLDRAGLVDYDSTEQRVTLSASGEEIAAEIERALGPLRELAARTRQDG